MNNTEVLTFVSPISVGTAIILVIILGAIAAYLTVESTAMPETDEPHRGAKWDQTFTWLSCILAALWAVPLRFIFDITDRTVLGKFGFMGAVALECAFLAALYLNATKVPDEVPKSLQRKSVLCQYGLIFCLTAIPVTVFLGTPHY